MTDLQKAASRAGDALAGARVLHALTSQDAALRRPSPKKRIAVVALLSALGCSSPRPPGPIDRELDRVGKESAPGGARLEVLRGRARRGDTEGAFLVMLGTEHCYRVAGVFDDSVSGMTVTVTGPFGARVAFERPTASSPVFELCPKTKGLHRVAIEIDGHGEYGVAVLDPWPAPTAVAVASAAPSASTSVASTSTSVASTSTSAEPPSSTSASSACAALGAAGLGNRVLAGEHRACRFDADCITVKLDCGNQRCGGINAAFRAAYSVPLDCRGWIGASPTPQSSPGFDCDPQFGVEAPRCEAGCCISAKR